MGNIPSAESCLPFILLCTATGISRKMSFAVTVLLSHGCVSMCHFQVASLATQDRNDCLVCCTMDYTMSHCEQVLKIKDGF